MSRRGVEHLNREIELLLYRFLHEYSMTAAEVVGVLEFRKAMFINQTLNVMVQDEEEE